MKSQINLCSLKKNKQKSVKNGLKYLKTNQNLWHFMIKNYISQSFLIKMIIRHKLIYILIIRLLMLICPNMLSAVECKAIISWSYFLLQISTEYIALIYYFSKWYLVNHNTIIIIYIPCIIVILLYILWVQKVKLIYTVYILFYILYKLELNIKHIDDPIFSRIYSRYS